MKEGVPEPMVEAWVYDHVNKGWHRKGKTTGCPRWCHYDARSGSLGGEAQGLVDPLNQRLILDYSSKISRLG